MSTKKHIEQTIVMSLNCLSYVVLRVLSLGCIKCNPITLTEEILWFIGHILFYWFQFFYV